MTKTQQTEIKAVYPELGWEFPITVDKKGEYYVEWSFADVIYQSLRYWWGNRKKQCKHCGYYG